MITRLVQKPFALYSSNEGCRLYFYLMGLDFSFQNLFLVAGFVLPVYLDCLLTLATDGNSVIFA